MSRKIEQEQQKQKNELKKADFFTIRIRKNTSMKEEVVCSEKLMEEMDSTNIIECFKAGMDANSKIEMLEHLSRKGVLTMANLQAIFMTFASVRSENLEGVFKGGK